MTPLQRLNGYNGSFLLKDGIGYGLGYADINSSAGATSAGSIITVNSTTGIYPGMFISVTAGIGAFASGAIVKSVTDATHFVSSSAPTTALSGGASVVTFKQSVTLDWIECGTGNTITELEEFINGSSIDVLAQYGLTTGDSLPDNMTLVSKRAAGFSKVKITIASGNLSAYQMVDLQNVSRNNRNSTESGIQTRG